MSKSTLAIAHNYKPVIVVKLGGSMISQLTEQFYASLKKLTDVYECIIVHGGGPAITSMLERLNIQGEFHEGLRKTTPETLEVVEMTMGGKVNAHVTSKLAEQGVRAVGLKGSDANLITASLIDSETLGLVGKVDEVETTFLTNCLRGGYMPVIAPLGKMLDGRTVNINADIAASAIAKAMNAEKLLIVTDVPGIMHNGEVIEETTPDEISALISTGGIYGGMIPKVQSAVEALSERLAEVMIVSGKQAVIENGVMTGTKICAKRKEGVE
ncbi:acetylglutamate kinase [Halobacillus salinarum]|uniref:Acetylglutamate kinase n=1 Tax=Halobacillus salinarum TaxID=2932257 RepID=A0ABY4EL02_9BACI|nr:acetylglutamate kinase [Halobacillus salinarum]UOQ45143.1 acetylglutamate kinase [Halobacillus salinarum]